jgi:hypothetical protein
MQPSRLWVKALFSAVSLTLVACAAQTTLPLRVTSVDNSLGATANSGTTVRPAAISVHPAEQPLAGTMCDLYDTWYFRGPCIVATIKPAGSTFALRTYKGLTVSFGTGSNVQIGANQFIIGLGTGKSDIKGTSDGILFPFYVGDRCENPYGTPETCHGRPLLYIEEVNDGDATVTLKDTPSITIINTVAYPGKTCYLDSLSDPFGVGNYFWVKTPIKAVVHGTRLSMPLAKLTNAFQLPVLSIIYWAVTCR